METIHIFDEYKKEYESEQTLHNKRTQIVAAFEEQVRKGFAIRSTRLLNELISTITIFCFFCSFQIN